ncbi:uncharacterized protein LOC111718309 [Eurytemora carolleeae]|uniref:uncharacterized protein LOC111718309 n=1 Tax=Eurytemora carolleeae TaxID=1294199 RepID=UPI000C77E067|nr:uncharacterized protein LOC111718309 [Eurytemora carolleeae]|eukprot:XP_023349638.1 uncharacterized protein LOC111718309 [Eurytemora affinis]
MIHRNGSEVESVRSNNGFETARNKSAENLRNLSQVSPLGMSKNNRKYSPGLPGPSAQTFISANDHISNLLQSKHSGSTSDMSVSSVESSMVSPTNRRRRTLSTNLSEVDSSSKGNLSRSSSTLSLASTGVQPLDSILKHLRDGLCGQVFSGWYTERRFIDPIERYKDVLVVDQGETPIVKQVRYAIRKSAKVLGENTFIGFSYQKDEDECKIFVNLGSSSSVAQYPFGHFWFQIRQIIFLPNVGFCCDIYVLRQFLVSDEQSCWRCRQRELNVSNQPPVKLDSLGATLQDIRSREGVLQDICSRVSQLSVSNQPPVKLDSLRATLQDIRSRVEGVVSQILEEHWHPTQSLNNVLPYLSYENAVKLGRLCCVLLMAMLAGILSGLKLGANFMLRTLHELAFLVERSTPLALGTMNILSKLVGGFYLLVAMIWRDSTRPQPPTTNQRTISGIQPVLSGPSLRPIRHSPPPFTRPSSSPSSAPPLSAMDKMFSSNKNY